MKMKSYPINIHYNSQNLKREFQSYKWKKDKNDNIIEELYWSLLLQRLPLKAVMPMILRIENEQTLAKFCWGDLLTSGALYWQGVHPEKLVRRLLDWFLLGSYSSLSLTEILARLQKGLETELAPETWQVISQALAQ